MLAGLGILRGWFPSLNAAFARWMPGYGACSVEAAARVTLPHPLWATWMWVDESTSPTVGIGSSTAVQLAAVPADERWILESIVLSRASGDNTAREVRFVPPLGYGSSNRTGMIIRYTTAASDLYWPNRATAVDWERPFGLGILLEPGTVLNLYPSGAGAATSTWTVYLQMRKTKLVRSRAP